MSDLRELYQELILDHSKNPRNFRKLTATTHEAEGFNPLCGDHIWIYLQIADGRIGEATFQGSGCAICTASASVMTDVLKGKTTDEARHTFENFHGVVTGKAAADGGTLGKLMVFAGVSEFPVRVKCASLPWHTLTAALDSQAKATTE